DREEPRGQLMERAVVVEPGQTWVDLDKRNTGRRLVKVLRLYFSHDAYGARRLYASCETLTAGGRPCEWTFMPEKRGTGAVGEVTEILVDRMIAGRYGLVSGEERMSNDEHKSVRVQFEPGETGW